jgi:rubredoxin
MICPQCGSTKGFRLVARQDGSTGPMAAGCLATMFGGLLIPFLVRSSGLQLMTKCKSCGHVFSPPQPLGRSGFVAIGVLLILFSAAVYYVFLVT